jgi:uncharacterized membrane protein YadS
LRWPARSRRPPSRSAPRFPDHLPGALILAIVLAAVGLETDLRAIRAEGWRPLALGAAATVFIGTLACVLVALVHD